MRLCSPHYHMTTQAALTWPSLTPWTAAGTSMPASQQGQYSGCITLPRVRSSCCIACNHVIQPLFRELLRDYLQACMHAEPSAADALQPGTQLIAAAYALFSSATMLVLSVGHGVHGFTLDTTVGEFVLTHPNIRIPARGTRRPRCLTTLWLPLLCPY